PGPTAPCRRSGSTCATWRRSAPSLAMGAPATDRPCPGGAATRSPVALGRGRAVGRRGSGRRPLFDQHGDPLAQPTQVLGVVVAAGLADPPGRLVGRPVEQEPLLD